MVPTLEGVLDKEFGLVRRARSTILFGKGIAAGEYVEEVSPTDVAPTLPFLARITLSRSDGRLLREALAGEPLRSHASSLPR